MLPRTFIEGKSSTNIFDPNILAVIRRALAEDIGNGDITSDSIIPPDAPMQGRLMAKQSGVIAGLDVAQAVYAAVDPKVDFVPGTTEGARVDHGQT
ncbi:MAG TPA: hypothetical protein VF784_07380, partial [Anaerolineales bacterium]